MPNILHYFLGFGLIGYVATIAIALLFVTVANILYYDLQEGAVDAKRFSKFIGGIVASLIFCVILAFLAQLLLYKTPFLKVGVIYLDSLLISFAKLIKFQYILCWFLIPLAFVFIYYAVMSIIAYYKEKKMWIDWNKKQEEKEAKKLDEITPKNINDEASETEIETVEEKKTAKPKFKFGLFSKKKQPSEIEVAEDDLIEIDYRVPLKILKASKQSKKGILQLGRQTEGEGYVMVVNSDEHEGKLKEIVQSCHSNLELPKMPYIAFFDADDFEATPVKEYGKKLIAQKEQERKEVD